MNSVVFMRLQFNRLSRIAVAILLGIVIACAGVVSRLSAATDVNVPAKTYSSGSKTFEATNNITVTGAVVVNNTAALILDAGNAISFGTSGSLAANSGSTVFLGADKSITTSDQAVTINEGASVAFESLGSITLRPGFSARAGTGGTGFHASVPVNNARYVSQNVPAILNPGETRQVSLTFANSGGTWWSAANYYALGSVGDDDTWGLERVAFNGVVPPGQSNVFSFNIKAPSTYGTYKFQWRMVQDGVEWFGASSPEVLIEVAHWGYDATASHLVQPQPSHIQGNAGAFNSAPFVVTIRNASTEAPIASASVVVIIASGAGKLSTGTASNATLANSFTLKTDANGAIRFYYKHPAGAAATAIIYVISSGGSAVVTTSSSASTGAHADANGNGLPDATEAALGIAAGRSVQVIEQPGVVNLNVFTP